jgi:type I restriction enzyme S subunit
MPEALRTETPKIDIRPDHWAIVQRILQKHVPDREVWAFGSRAKWTAKEYSDLDLAILGDQPLGLAASAALADEFTESDLPWKVDVVDWATTSESFRKIIERDKVVVHRTLSKRNWVDCCLGDAIELKRGYDLPQQTRLPGTVPIFSSSGFSGFHTKAMSKSPGVVTGRYGTIGQVFYVDEAFWPLNTTLYVCDFKGNDPRFISYLLETIDYAAYSDKGAVPGVNRNHLHMAKVQLPPLDRQRAISSFIAILDKKITVSRRINQTLEATAQAIFQSWFIDFDPVKAKIAAQAEGRDPQRAAMCSISGQTEAQLDAFPPEQYQALAATAALFPDSLDEASAEELPAGWLASTLQQLTTKIGSGSTPRGGSEVYLEEGVALIRSQNVYDAEFVWDGLARISDAEAEKLKGVEVLLEDVLLNITGASILRTCVVPPAALPARVNQHVAIVRAKAGIPARYLHLHLLHPATKDYLIGLNAGGSREAVTKAHIESTPVFRPSGGVLAAFQQVTDAIYRQVEAFSAQRIELAELRDALLPKLLSGELTVPFRANSNSECD